jgi:pimeloyl-ACP methyl ester carboxylesterase
MMAQPDTTTVGRYVHANGIETFYLEAGSGQPLLLLHPGILSTNPVWTEWPSSYASYMATFAQDFRVIAPDLRGSGRTVHPGGPIPYDLLAEDVVALIDALDLGRPLIGGYGDGGAVATVVGIRRPDAVRAIVNNGGYELFNPDPHTPGLIMTRQMLGGSPDASAADPDLVATSEHTFLRTMVELMKADHDVAQGAGHWKTVLRQSYARFSQPAGYTLADLERVTVPTLLLVGDRDPFDTVEEGVAAYRALPDGELAIMPNTTVGITPAVIDVTIDFFKRRAG